VQVKREVEKGAQRVPFVRAGVVCAITAQSMAARSFLWRSRAQVVGGVRHLGAVDFLGVLTTRCAQRAGGARLGSASTQNRKNGLLLVTLSRSA